MKAFFRWSVAGLGVVLGQALLGAVVVRTDLHAGVVTAHYVTALALVGIATGIWASSTVFAGAKVGGAQHSVQRMAVGALIALLPLLLVGAYVRERGAGLAYPDWPLMGGRLIPSLASTTAKIHFIHRALALFVTGHLIVLARRARRDERGAVRVWGRMGLVLFLGQIILGAASVWTKLGAPAVVAHTSMSYGVWASYVVLAVVAGRSAAAAPERSAMRDRVHAYSALTKPRIIGLLLVTTVPAMILAAGALPPLWLIGATLLGGMMTAGSANALNQYLERDIDEKMDRTRSRPLPAHNIAPRNALIFALVLGVGGFAWLDVVVNLLSAVLAVAAIAFYVVVYTILLKRTTSQNIVIGGAAGAAPVLIGWAAVTGTVGAPAWVMFAIVFLWTPPHFWALAMRFKDDYAAAGIPMLPVVKGAKAVTAQVLAYAVVLVVATLLMSPVGGLGALYAVSATALGAGFVYRAMKLRADPGSEAAMKLFHYSITYLALLFAAMAVDRLVW